ncbi:S1-like domain-containing RNA-binding protein [Aquibacillus sp. 3ASR75-11]|uniref:S1-like domain-containing RNA-binding protein n=1 Tax=Terrihalobacillus insolitus TaxID=2950438 RepID=A0A9X3WNB9_9BACI|nr:S1-like domain-containing RNA-binding protein [Terrihalobacillus insolitus]MDC3412115.1 S1-like domain-containing RNA-binding protein [Terrihalobacillus insolitus]MDC3423192.1 S1-like domain-containing RNA-binding protein [Terrihalobacillus insolitus]
MALEVGAIHKLIVLRKIDTGYVLKNGTNEVLLHKKETKGELEVDQEIEVFLYHDKKGQVVATMSLPNIRVDTYDWAEVVEVVKDLGVFVSIGIAKEILVSKDDLPLIERVWPQVGDMLYVTLSTDKQGRLLAIPITEGVFEGEWETAPSSINNTPINGRVYRTNKEGSVILTEEGYRGFIHHTERKAEPRLGQWVEGRVIAVKEDGTINVSLRPLKREGMVKDADMILKHIEKNSGVIPFSDKSDPEDIDKTFHISKASFKRALGKLMKEGKVIQKDGKTFLKEEKNQTI